MKMQKVKAYLTIIDEYGLAIRASQWPSELQEHCDEYNAEMLGEDWRQKRRKKVMMTVEFEVPCDVFDPPNIPLVKGQISEEE